MIKRLQRRTVRAGFIDGFTSPFLVFYSSPLHFSYRNRDTVREAWQKVGKDLRKATKTEGTRIGKTSSTEQGNEFVHN